MVLLRSSLQRLWVLLFVTATLHAQSERRWSFRVLLDGKPIGSHVFTLRDKGGLQELTSQADFRVKVVGITLYRYEHLAVEQWRDGCLISMQATTNDDGKKLSVQVQTEKHGLVVEANAAKSVFPSCSKTYAYWNPSILASKQLLNAQTGRLDSVAIQTLGSEVTLDAQGVAISAQRYRIVGPDQPITLWYDKSGNWVGLESQVGKQRRLTYRLQ